jgi:hypothetical protein
MTVVELTTPARVAEEAQQRIHLGRLHHAPLTFHAVTRPPDGRKVTL